MNASTWNKLLWVWTLQYGCSKLTSIYRMVWKEGSTHLYRQSMTWFQSRKKTTCCKALGNRPVNLTCLCFLGHCEAVGQCTDWSSQQKNLSPGHKTKQHPHPDSPGWPQSPDYRFWLWLHSNVHSVWELLWYDICLHVSLLSGTRLWCNVYFLFQAPCLMHPLSCS